MCHRTKVGRVEYFLYKISQLQPQTKLADLLIFRIKRIILFGQSKTVHAVKKINDGNGN